MDLLRLDLPAVAAARGAIPAVFYAPRAAATPYSVCEPSREQGGGWAAAAAGGMFNEFGEDIGPASALGKVVQVDPIKPKLKAPGIERLN